MWQFEPLGACFRVLNCYEDQEDLANHANAVFTRVLQCLSPKNDIYTSIIAIPRGGLALASLSTTPWWQLVNMGLADYQSLLKNHTLYL